MPEVLEPQNRSAEVTRAVNVPLSSSIIPRRGPWTQQGLRELDRIRAECTPHSSFDAVIDEGEFWCIVWDREREFVGASKPPKTVHGSLIVGRNKRSAG